MPSSDEKKKLIAAWIDLQKNAEHINRGHFSTQIDCIRSVKERESLMKSCAPA